MTCIYTKFYTLTMVTYNLQVSSNQVNKHKL